MKHTCHWVDCEQEVDPAMWGCAYHWFKLPKYIRTKIWKTHVPGQEITKTPGDGYLEAAKEATQWSIDNRQD